MFQRILVANRGEIALRVIRACKELDIEAVAVYSQADRDAAYLALADKAICIGKSQSSDSYLNRSRIIAAAEIADAQAIHPGYGFLSENPDFAEVCRLSGFEFIGPPHEAIRKMGLKTEAKKIAAAAKVACVPGSEGVIASETQAISLARAIGYPVLIKAAAGGGGKGMRICRDESNLAGALQTASSEAEAAFKNASVYLEKFIDRPRHVEVQILADSHGETVSLWDRDCTLQRRHQKLVEESPAPTLPAKVRTKLSEAAVRLAKAAGYVNAGTCEFLVDSDNNFYFIEVNARIQVEHPVTEMVTGIDLVKQQIMIAAGEPLPFRQKDINLRGHSIECRINSEDPEHDFRPSPGRIADLRVPGGPGVRWDSHIYPGYVVPPYYDSLLGKLIVHAPTRPEAIATMRRALDELRIEGVQTTIPLHRRIFRDADFIAARVDTTWVERVLLGQKP
jgi:acetyl-CoA carboxylase, biotin carboxylase subunit